MLASNMVIDIVNREMRSILYLDKPIGAMYPEKDLPAAEQRLKGFKWLKDKRPLSKWDIFK